MKHINSTKTEKKDENKEQVQGEMINTGTQYPLDNNTGHSGNNHNSTALEIPIRGFHDSTHRFT